MEDEKSLTRLELFSRYFHADFPPNMIQVEFSTFYDTGSGLFKCIVSNKSHIGDREKYFECEGKTLFEALNGALTQIKIEVLEILHDEVLSLDKWLKSNIS